MSRLLFIRKYRSRSAYDQKVATLNSSRRDTAYTHVRGSTPCARLRRDTEDDIATISMVIAPAQKALQRREQRWTFWRILTVAPSLRRLILQACNGIWLRSYGQGG